MDIEKAGTAMYDGHSLKRFPLMGLAMALCLGGCMGSSTQDVPTQTTPLSPLAVTVTNLPAQLLPEDYRSLLYADQSLADLQTTLKGTPQGPDDWLALFRDAYSASQNNDKAGAEADLKRILNASNVETRIQLWAWNALRDLGQTPDPSEANTVQGLVLEIPSSGAVDTMAVYQDGRARYFNGKFGLQGGIIWEAPGKNPQIDSLVAAVLKSAEDYQSLSPKLISKHQPITYYNFRITVLTFSGMYVIQTQDLGPIKGIVDSGARLLMAFNTLRAQNQAATSPATPINPSPTGQ
jgi:hypothetical protein